jgi:hypothetical protein
MIVLSARGRKRALKKPRGSGCEENRVESEPSGVDREWSWRALDNGSMLFLFLVFSALVPDPDSSCSLSRGEQSVQ